MNRIAIVGATGLVGRTIIQVLQEEGIPGKYEYYNSRNLTHTAVRRFRPNYALFAVEADIARKWVPFFANLGCTVIDNSSAYRTDPTVPLVIPECNPDTLVTAAASILQKKNAKPFLVQNTSSSGGSNGLVVANPNCSTIGALVALKPLDDAFGIRRIVYSTYQAISGAGVNPIFAHPIENNLIPYIAGEEEKMIFETKKILGRPDIAVTATCVRVPLANCHSISINAEFNNSVDIEKVKELLRTAPGVIFMDDGLPMPLLADGKNDVYAGRVRMDESQPNTINLFTVSDNVRKGAAVNAVQILRCLIQ